MLGLPAEPRRWIGLAKLSGGRPLQSSRNPLHRPKPAPALHKPAAWPPHLPTLEMTNFPHCHEEIAGFRVGLALGILRSHRFMVAQTGKELAPGGTQ